jgi:hypothetical protein
MKVLMQYQVVELVVVLVEAQVMEMRVIVILGNHLFSSCFFSFIIC